MTGPESSTADTTSVEFGAAMRDMRKAHNRELSDVANALRIRQTHLQAIEEGRFDDLPGPTYAAGFVRAYADYLGLELDEVMRRYRSATSGISAQTPLVPPSPMTEARLPTGFILLIAAVMAAAAYGGWYYLTIHGQSPTEVVSALPKKISDAVGLSQNNDSKPDSSDLKPDAKVTTPAPVISVSKPPEESSVAKPPSETVKTEPAKIAVKTDAAADLAKPTTTAETVVEKTIETVDVKKPVAPAQSTEVAAPATSTASSNSASVVGSPPPAESGSEQVDTTTPLNSATTVAIAPSQPTVAPAVQAPDTAEKLEVAKKPTESEVTQVASVAAPQQLESRVVLRATVTSWVELRDGDGKRLISRLLKAGETYKVPGRSGILFNTGNAGGVDILVDGQTIAALGPIGAVRRDIPMDPETLLTRKPGQR